MRKSIDSIVNQTYTNWELLILDDCSADCTQKIAHEYVKKDNRIHYYRNEQNLRLPKNLNKGFSLAKGDYLTWTSDDNLYKPTALEKMLKALKDNPSAHFAFASCRIIDEDDKGIEYIMVNQNSPKRIVGMDSVGACFLYTRTVYEQIGDYDSAYTLVEDFDYWQRIFQKFQVVPIDEILYLYRWHDGALTSTMKKDLFYKTLEKMLLKNRPGFGKIDAEEKYYYYQGLYTCRKNLKDEKNPYANPYRFYRSIYLVQHRIPNKIKRMIRKHL